MNETPGPATCPRCGAHVNVLINTFTGPMCGSCFMGLTPLPDDQPQRAKRLNDTNKKKPWWRRWVSTRT